MKVLITGATGLLGSAVTSALRRRGDDVVALSRSAHDVATTTAEAGELRWLRGDPSVQGSWLDEIGAVDGVIHLAGESIASGRWTAARKRKLVESRVESTKRIAEAIRRAVTPPRFFVCASAVGVYGYRGEEVLDETSAPGADFLAHLCVDWESAARGAKREGVRVVMLRLGVVLSSQGGALARMRPIFRLGVGGPLGPPERFFPWVHLDDAVALVIHACSEDPVREGLCQAGGGLEGPVNVVAPGAARMREFARGLGRALGRPAVLPVPMFALRPIIGGLADALAPGQHVIPRAALEAGHRFRFPELDAALADCIEGHGPAAGSTR